MPPTSWHNARQLCISSSLNCATINTCHDVRCHMHMPSFYTMQSNRIPNSLRSVLLCPYATISNTYQYVVLSDVCHRVASSYTHSQRRCCLMLVSVSPLCEYPTYILFTTLLLYSFQLNYLHILFFTITATYNLVIYIPKFCLLLSTFTFNNLGCPHE